MPDDEKVTMIERPEKLVGDSVEFIEKPTPQAPGPHTPPEPQAFEDQATIRKATPEPPIKR